MGTPLNNWVGGVRWQSVVGPGRGSIVRHAPVPSRRVSAFRSPGPNPQDTEFDYREAYAAIRQALETARPGASGALLVEVSLVVHRSRRTPLNGPPDFFVAKNRPVEVSRFVQLPVFGFWTWLRPETAPYRPPPLAPFLAIVASPSVIRVVITTVPSRARLLGASCTGSAW